jgi:branched-chain amino acid transport system permease protein
MTRDLTGIAIFALAVLALTLWLTSGVWLNALMMTLYGALLALAWNLLGGFGGQFSFGHALFFGTGAYASAVLQVAHGVNAWPALLLAAVAAALVGGGVGALVFRYGLKGSYFALVTLAFAEVFRIVALSVGFTGGGVGLMLPLSESVGTLQFASRKGFIGLMLALVAIALCATAWLRHSRFGAQLQAVRDNEDAARAIGVDPTRTKLLATIASAALMGVAGAFYLQVFHYIDPAIAFGPHVSVEALVGAIVGGMGTLWGPVLGAAVLHALGEGTRNLFGQLPGLNLVIYGVVLVAIVLFMPRGLAGLGPALRTRWPGDHRD